MNSNCLLYRVFCEKNALKIYGKRNIGVKFILAVCIIKCNAILFEIEIPINSFFLFLLLIRHLLHYLVTKELCVCVY